MSKINVTELDSKQVKKNLKDFLRGQDRFKDFDFEGSNISVLLDVLAYNTVYSGFYANMIANEMFLDTAILRESIVSRAKAIGYTPASRRSARASVLVQFLSVPTGTPEIIVQRGEKFAAYNGSKRYLFTVERTTVVRPNVDGHFIGEIPLVEGLRLSHEFVYDVTSELPQRFIIPNANVDTTSIFVRVKQSATSSVVENFTQNTDLNQINEDSKVFFLNEVEDKKYEVWFGDGILGRALEDGNIVLIDYVVSSGAEANSIRQFKPETSLAGYPLNRLKFETVQTAQSGAERESDQSIRQVAPMFYESQNRAVTRNDYETLIKKDFPEIEFVRVWGGEDHVPPMYGKVFLSVKPYGSTALSTDRKQQLINEIIRNRNLVSIEVDIVEPDFLYVIVDSKVRFNPHVTNLSDGDVQKQVIESIKNFRHETLIGFNSSFRYSKLVKIIDDSEPSIINNSTNITMRYRLLPPINFAERYVIRLNNAISRGDSANNISAINSTGFTLNGITTYIGDNGKGSLYYYRLVANVRIPIRQNVGTVNYDTGEIIINNFIAQGYPAGVDYLDLYVKPASTDLVPLRNQIITIEDSDINVTVERDI